MLSFSGKFLYAADGKGRINIPAPFRSQLSEPSDSTFHVLMGPDGCLFVYPREVFQGIAQKLEKKYGSMSTPPEQRRFFLKTMANAHPTRCDQQGRIIIPEEHRQYAAIENEVLIIGAVNKLEFWNPGRYAAFIAEGDLNDQDRVRRFGGVDREWPWDG